MLQLRKVGFVTLFSFILGVAVGGGVFYSKPASAVITPNDALDVVSVADKEHGVVCYVFRYPITMSCVKVSVF